ncbi:MAG: sodium-dependent transporter [Candidatus Acidoferrales bacterium]
MGETGTREVWGTRLGLILAASGNAIGIGNLLRFPGQAATNGGGAFMIPYIVCLFIFGIPMMWVAWTIGRHGGRYGHGSLPGMFDRMWRSPLAKYVGVLGVVLPLVFVLYYTYIEAWCLGYAWFSFTGDYLNTPGHTVHLTTYYSEFLGEAPTGTYFPGLTAAMIFMGITLVLNLVVLYRGVVKGIELLAKVAIPLLFLFCILMAVRVFTLSGEGTALEGLNFIWKPDFSRLGEFGVWLAAAGQIFFTLSIGFGSLECYASYVRKDDDIALTGLTTAATNEFVEVIFGAMIAIPAAAVFYGASQIERVASAGTYSIGMISMPEILRSFPSPEFFGSIWFLLLFFAAFTSSVAVSQPVMAFFQDELTASRGKATVWLGLLWALGVLPVILFYKYGVLDELDFWAGTVGLVFMALVEVILFAWVFRAARGWQELNRGAMIRVAPGPFKFVVTFITPVALAFILGGWIYVDVVEKKKLTPKPKLAIWLADPAQHVGTLGNAEVAGDDANTSFAKDFERSLKEQATEAKADGLIEALVRFGADGAVEVTNIHASGSLASETNPDRLERYLRGRGYQYMEKASSREHGIAMDREVAIIVTVLYTAPYIWMARGMILAFGLLFLFLIKVAWKRRGRGLTAEAAA